MGHQGLQIKTKLRKMNFNFELNPIIQNSFFERIFKDTSKCICLRSIYLWKINCTDLFWVYPTIQTKYEFLSIHFFSFKLFCFTYWSEKYTFVIYVLLFVVLCDIKDHSSLKDICCLYCQRDLVHYLWFCFGKF